MKRRREDIIYFMIEITIDISTKMEFKLLLVALLEKLFVDASRSNLLHTALAGVLFYMYVQGHALSLCRALAAAGTVRPSALGTPGLSIARTPGLANASNRSICGRCYWSICGCATAAWGTSHTVRPRALGTPRA